MTKRIGETRDEFLSRCREYEKTRYLSRRDRKLAYMRTYRINNLDRERARCDAWHSDPKNREKRNATQRRYNKTEERRLYRRNLRRRQREYDINYRILCSLRTRLNSALKGLNKSNRTIELLGCDIDFLRLHLAAQFTDGMNWANYGKWQIDHVIPCAEFDLRDPNQQHQCFNFSNLKPMWAIENAKKGSKVGYRI